MIDIINEMLGFLFMVRAIVVSGIYHWNLPERKVLSEIFQRNIGFL